MIAENSTHMGKSLMQHGLLGRYRINKNAHVYKLNVLSVITYHRRTLSTTCMTLLMSSLALLLVSARTDRDIIIQTTGGAVASKGGVRPKTPDGWLKVVDQRRKVRCTSRTG